MIKKLTALALSVVCVFALSAPVFADDLMINGNFYSKQDGWTTCTLSAAAMMLSRRAYLNGDENWTSVTEAAVKPYAWSNGLSHHFTYDGMTVSYGTLSSYGNEEELIALLDEHPEGIVAYDRTMPHAVLLTDYTDGVFYAADPAIGASFGRIPVSATTINLNEVSGYWYVSADANTQLEDLPVEELTVLGMFHPENIRTGNSFSLSGILKSPEGNPLTEVSLKIIDANGEVVQESDAELEPDTTEWSFYELDKYIIFNTLPAGEYGFSFVAKDSTGTTLCFARNFTVSDNSTVTNYYWSPLDEAV